MAQDYTDGKGWSKLDATCAHRLAETMCAMRGRTADKRREMLLWCFSRLGKGKTPTFRVGARTLAEECGVTRRAAMMFLKLMESEGWFVTVGKTQSGLTPARTFWWFAEGGGTRERTTLVRKPRSQRTGGWYVNHGSGVPQQTTELSEGVNNSVVHSTPPLPAPAGAGPGGVRTETEAPPPPPPPESYEP